MNKLILVLVLMMTAPMAFADEDNMAQSPWKSEATYGSQAVHKLGFGAKNMLLGWTELIQEPIEQKNPLGVVQGLGNAVMDTIGGFLHLLTSPITTVDVPLPENGVSILK